MFLFYLGIINPNLVAQAAPPFPQCSLVMTRIESAMYISDFLLFYEALD